MNVNGFRFDLPDRYNASAILFDNMEAGRGSKVAIRCGDATVSYDDLCDDAARVGNGLQDLGVPAGSRVLLLLLDTRVTQTGIHRLQRALPNYRIHCLFGLQCSSA